MTSRVRNPDYHVLTSFIPQAALTGSLMGSLIIYVFPGLFRLKSLQALGKPFTIADKATTYGFIGTGAVLGVAGVVVSFLKQFTNVLG
jgi:hypothetical protein